jgi:hypothetical protein
MRAKPSSGQLARAGAELVDLRARQMRHREQEIRRRLVLLRLHVAIALEPSLRAAHEHRRRIAPIVLVAVAHAAAPVEQRVIE